MKRKSTPQYSFLANFSYALMGVAWSVLPIAASAQDSQAQQATPSQVELPKVVMMQSMKVGEATHKLLDLQARGLMASERQYPVPAAVAERIYQRYLASFEHPIAEKSGSALDAIK